MPFVKPVPWGVRVSSVKQSHPGGQKSDFDVADLGLAHSVKLLCDLASQCRASDSKAVFQPGSRLTESSGPDCVFTVRLFNSQMLVLGNQN